MKSLLNCKDFRPKYHLNIFYYLTKHVLNYLDYAYPSYIYILVDSYK